MRSGTLAVALVIVLLATGCAAEAPAAPGPTDVSPSPASPSPTATESPLAAAPAPVLPFSCDEAIPASTITQHLGFALPATTPSDAYLLAAYRQKGWDDCSWYSADPYATVSYSVGLHPRDTDETWTGDLGIPESSLECSTYGAARGCSGNAVVNGYSVYLHSHAPKGSAVDARTIFTSVVSMLAAAQRPEPWVRPDGAWPLIVDCAAVDAAVDLPASVGMPDVPVVDETGRTEDGTAPRDRAAIGGETVCAWRTDGLVPSKVDKFAVSFLAGGSWLWDELHPLPGVVTEAVELDGADAAYLDCSAETCTLVARLGLDAIRINGFLSDSALPLTRDQLVAIATEVVPAANSVIP